MEQWNSVGGNVEQCWCNSGTVMVEQCRWNNESEIVRWNSKTVFVEKWNRVGGTV